MSDSIKTESLDGVFVEWSGEERQGEEYPIQGINQIRAKVTLYSMCGLWPHLLFSVLLVCWLVYYNL